MKNAKKSLKGMTLGDITKPVGTDLSQQSNLTGNDNAARDKLNTAYGKLPLYFIQNDGQVDEKVKVYEKGSGHATYFTK